jgi:sulfide:quinone oxidoreductase
VLIDQSDAFVFGFSKLDVMFGRAVPSGVRHPYRDVVKPGVKFVQATVQSIDPVAKRVETDAGRFEGDVIVLALGADLDPSATPGLLEGGHEFYTVNGAFAARDVLAGFGGGRVIIGVLSTPFKCPPAPSETALLLHDNLVDRGLRDGCEISLVMDFPRPIPPSPEASSALVTAFADRGIEWHPRREVCELDPSRKVAILRDGGEMAYDLFLGVPVHRAPAVVVESGMTVDGWIPVDPLTLETSFPGVYAVGDVAAVGTPRAGVFAEGHAAVAAERIGALIRGTTTSAQYGGRGICYLEFGRDQVALVDVTFFGEQRTGRLMGPSEAFAAEKVEFGSSRIKRWFGREWTAT